MPVMPSRRIFPSAAYMTPADEEPVRSVVVETPEAVVVAWYVQPGQRIPAHIHPAGQDTWTVLSGQGLYQTNAEGDTRPLKPGDIAIAGPGSVHGVYVTATKCCSSSRSSRPQRRATSACRTPPEIGTSPERASGRGLLGCWPLLAAL